MRTLRLGLALALLLTFGASIPAAAEYECAAAKDLIVRAIEDLHGQAQKADLESGLNLLAHAENMCPTLGDVWYYKALFQQQLVPLEAATATAQLKRKRQLSIDDALQSASHYHSEAMSEGISPFTLAAPTGELQVAGPVQQKWGLVVGISHFTATKLNALEFTRKDAQDIAATLTDPKFGRFQPDHIQLLTDNEATLVNIKAALNKIARQAGPSDLVFVFIASHGTSRLQDKVGQLSYIVAYDTDLANEDSLYASSLPMVEISQIVRSRIQAHRTVIVLDTCYSGGAGKNFINSAAPSSSSMDALKAGVGRAVIAASSEKQKSHESNDLENGVFTHYFVEGLKQKGGQLPLSKVFAYASEQVTQWTAAQKEEPQTPVMFRSENSDDIVLGVAPPTQSAHASANYGLR
jgi:hypothetical protein